MKSLLVQPRLSQNQLDILSGHEITVSLKKGELFTVPNKRHGARLVCQSGRLWLTQENDRDDHLINAGESFILSGKGKVIVQGMPQGTLTLS